jgi:signal transduction histidine kinase
MTMGLKGAALFLANGTDELTLRGCTGFECPLARDASLLPECSLGAGCPLKLSMPLSLDSSLAHLLHQEARPLENTDLQRRLEDAPLLDTDRAWLETGHVRLWLPLVFKDRLRGLLLMGGKEGGELFDTEDLRILETLAHQAALTAENIHLLNSLRRRADELGRLRDELEVANRRLLASREDERKMLARELHDQLLQDIFALNIGLQATMGMVDEEGPVAEHLTGMHQEVIRLADEVRRLCTELRPPSLSVMGLADAIRSHTTQLARRRGNIHVVGGFLDSLWEDEPGPDLIITLDLAQDRKLLDEQVAIALFRVYQEALVNVEKHAEAHNVWVQERLNENKVELSVSDDGCGFITPSQLSQLVRQGHFGLLGGQERMAAVGGGIRVTSQLEEGTELLAWAPANKREPE